MLSKAPWLFGLVLACCSPASAVVISELMYHPQTDEAHNEYVELYNETATRLDLSGWQFNEGIDIVFSSGTVLSPFSYLVVARHPATIMSRYGITNVVGPFGGALNNSSDHILLRDPVGAVMAEVDYSDDGKWPVAADGAGHSLSKFNLRGDPMDPDNWRASPLPGGTPGRDNGFQPTYEDTVLIAPGDSWRYFKGLTEASNPVTAWRQITFDDSSWSSGPTGIGYGDGDDATTITDMQQGVPPGNPGYWCIFCRKTFTLADPASISELILEIDHDDGFVAYLNGTDVGRAAMSTTGPVTYTTPATSHEASRGNSSPQPPTVLDITSYKGVLQAGTNVLAVQIHNNVLNSSDLSFIPTLRSRKTYLPGQTVSPAVINEVCFHTFGTQFIELYNRGEGPANVGRYYLSNDPDNLRLFQIPTDTMIPAHGRIAFLQSQLGFYMNTAGDRVLFTSPTGNVVLDARAVEPGPSRWSEGRWPDGAAEWFNMSPTTGTANAVTLTTAVVINEIMYHPPTENESDEYVELYNAGATTVSLAGWSFSRGISYDFSSTASIGPRRYLVIAKDRNRLISRYGLLPAIILGNFVGQLDDAGEKVRLRDANYNIADEVTYSEGGHWSEYADGYGSSLELIDPRHDNTNYQAWAPGNETSKVGWTSFTVTGIGNVPADWHLDELQLMLSGPGEVLVDDISLTRGAVEYIANGGFESGIGGWVIMGNHVRSYVTTETAHSGSRCLKIIATGCGDTGANHIEQDAQTTMTTGQIYTLRFWAKWRYGNNLLFTRLWDDPSSFCHNALRETNVLPIPALTGTPGTTNSVYRANLGPVFRQVGHSPIVPNGSNSVTVRAHVSDPDGLTTVRVYYKADSDGSYAWAAMRDDGLGGDELAGDGVYTGTIPPRTAGQTVAFYFVGADGRGASTSWPTDLSRPAHYRVETNPWSSIFPRYRIIMTAAELSELFNRPHLSNEPMNCTFIFDDKDVYYNCGIRFVGSPFGRGGSGYRGYKVLFNADEKLHGVRTQARFDAEGGTKYHNRITYDLLRSWGLPYGPGEYVDVRVNARVEGINDDIIAPGKNYLNLFFRGDDNGPLFELSCRYEFTNDNDLNLQSFTRQLPTWQDWGPDKDIYRFTYRPRNHDRLDDFTTMIAAVKVIGHIPGGTTEAEVAGLIEVQQWLRVMAAISVNAHSDFFATNGTKNAYFYLPLETGRWALIPWDCELSFSNGNANASLWSTRAGIEQIRYFEHFRSHEHYFLNGVHEYMAKYFNHAFMDSWVDYYYSVVGGHQPADFRTFIDNRRASVQTQIAPYLPPSTILNITTPDPLAVPEFTANLAGTAPVNVSWIRCGGRLYWPGWSDATHWYATIDVPPNTNDVTLEFLNYDKNLVGTDSITIIAPPATLHFVTDMTSVTISEGGTALLRLKLDGLPVGATTVTVSRIGGDSDITVTSGGTLIFTPSNWNTYRTVRLAAAEDADAANGQAMIRLHGTALGPLQSIEDKNLTATEADNDELLFVTDVPAATVPEGGSAQLRVKLTAQPLGTVTVSVSRVSGDSDLAVTSGGTLTFTPSNWNIYQAVTLTAAEDPDAANGQATFRVHAIGLSIADKDAVATEADNDQLAFLTDVQAVTVLEGGMAPLRVQLTAQPLETVTVTVSRVSGDSDLAVTSGGTLTFTPSNWNIYQAVTLTAAEDPDAANGQATFRVHAIGLSIADKDVAATEADDDLMLFMTDVPAVTVPEGESVPFRVKLTAQPLGAVTVTVSRISGDSDIVVTSGGILTFTASNWNTYQTVTLSAAPDPDTIIGRATIRIQATAGATIPFKDVVATEGEPSTAVRRWRQY